LLIRLGDKQDTVAWAQFVEVYAPLVYGFARKHGMQDADAADLTQEVMRAVAGAIIGGSISAYLIGHFGWRAAFVFGGACSTVLLPIVILYLPESLDFLIAAKTTNALRKRQGSLERRRRQVHARQV